MTHEALLPAFITPYLCRPVPGYLEILINALLVLPSSYAHSVVSLLRVSRPQSKTAISPSSILRPNLIPALKLRLQHNTINTRLHKRKHQTRLPLQLPQSIQNLCRGLARHVIQNTRKLPRTHQHIVLQIQEGGGAITFFMFSANRSYSSSTSCSRGVRSGFVVLWSVVVSEDSILGIGL